MTIACAHGSNGIVEIKQIYKNMTGKVTKTCMSKQIKCHKFGELLSEIKLNIWGKIH